jgi:hypothetical protein
MPKGGESFEYQSRRYGIERMDGHRVALVRIEPMAQASLETETAPSSNLTNVELEVSTQKRAAKDR